MDVGGWMPEKMGLAVAIVLTGHELQIFAEKDIGKLERVLNSAKCVVGYNLKGFDFHVLEGLGMNVKKVKCQDLMLDLEGITGSRMMLKSLKRDTLGIKQDIDSLEAVERWKEGDVLAVIEIITNQVFAIQAIHEYGRTNGEVFYRAKGSTRRTGVKVRW